MSYTGKVSSAESLGRILQQARMLPDLSQRELAERLGTYPRSTFSMALPRASSSTSLSR